MNARDSIINKLGNDRRNPPIALPEIYSFTKPNASPLLDQFRQTAQKNGIRVELIDHPKKIPSKIADLCKKQSIDGKTSIAPALSHLPWKSCKNFYFGKNDGSYVVGVSQAAAAVAQTGAVVLINRPDNPASISFLSTDHDIILRESDIRSSLSDIWIMDFEDSNAIHLISGPSSTADIGGKLLIGVHGPEKLTYIIY